VSALERPRLCPVELLEPGDVIEVYFCVEGDEYDWVRRTVVTTEQVDGGTLVRYRVPDGWEGGGQYDVRYEPGRTERLAFVDVPLLWEGDGA
jgi:hypothetical protein